MTMRTSSLLDDASFDSIGKPKGQTRTRESGSRREAVKIGLASLLMLSAMLALSWHFGLIPLGRPSLPAGVEARAMSAEDLAAHKQQQERILRDTRSGKGSVGGD